MWIPLGSTSDEAKIRARSIFGMVTMCFMFGYASGLIINGNIGDKMPTRLFYGCSLLATSLVYFVLFIVKEYDSDGKFQSPTFFKIMLALGGIF